MKNPTKKQLLKRIEERIDYHEQCMKTKRFEEDKLPHIEALKELNSLKTFISGE